MVTCTSDAWSEMLGQRQNGFRSERITSPHLSRLLLNNYNLLTPLPHVVFDFHLFPCQQSSVVGKLRGKLTACQLSEVQFIICIRSFALVWHLWTAVLFPFQKAHEEEVKSLTKPRLAWGYAGRVVSSPPWVNMREWRGQKASWHRALIKDLTVTHEGVLFLAAWRRLVIINQSCGAISWSH